MLTRLFFAKLNSKKKPYIIGGKNSYYTLFIEDIIKMYHQAKFICITQDYRDNILSFQNMKSDLISHAALAYRWLIFNLN